MITFITGGAGSGKTTYSLQLASKYKSKIYIATAEHTDSEMTEKIMLHQKERDKSYITIEEPVELSNAIGKADKKADVIVIDCITFWTNNLIYYKKNVSEYFENFLSTLKNCNTPVILVSNEVGFSLIPADKASRNYVKQLSFINKKISGISDNVILMVAGLPVEIKKLGVV